MEEAEMQAMHIGAIEAKLKELGLNQEAGELNEIAAKSAFMPGAQADGSLQVTYRGADAVSLKEFGVGAKQLKRLVDIAVKNPDMMSFAQVNAPASVVSMRVARRLDRPTFGCMVAMRLHNVAVVNKTPDAWNFLAKSVDGRLFSEEIKRGDEPWIDPMRATQRALLAFARQACSPAKPVNPDADIEYSPNTVDMITGNAAVGSLPSIISGGIPVGELAIISAATEEGKSQIRGSVPLPGLDETDVLSWGSIKLVEGAMTDAEPAPEPCQCADHMGEHACSNRQQCWEPCGELGKSEEHAVVVDVITGPEELAGMVLPVVGEACPNKLLTLIPVFRDEYADQFVSPRLVPTKTAMLGGTAIITAPLATGKEINLLSISEYDALLKNGTMDLTDHLDPDISLKCIYVKVKECVIVLNAGELPLSAYVFGQDGNYRQMHLNFSGLFGFNNKNLPAVFSDSQQSDIGVILRITMKGTANLEFGTVTAYCEKLEIHEIGSLSGAVIDPDGDVVRSIRDLFGAAEVIGYDLNVFRSQQSRATDRPSQEDMVNDVFAKITGKETSVE